MGRDGSRQRKMRIRLVAVDDDSLSRREINEMLSEWSETIEVLAFTRSATECIRAVREFHPDVILLDLHLPGRNGIALARFFRPRSSARMVALTSFLPTYGVSVALQAGVRGYLTKDATIDDHEHLLRAITSAFRGEEYLTPDAAAARDREALQPVQTFGLPPRTYEAIELLSNGLSDRQIAEAMVVSEATVRDYFKTAKAKWNVEKRADLIRLFTLYAAARQPNEPDDDWSF